MANIRAKMIAVIGLLVLGAALAPVAGAGQSDQAQTMAKVRKELVTLPYYGVFDNLAYEVNGSTVTLSGQVVNPTTRKDAENRIKRIAGVTQVIDNIQVLPVSGFDNSIRVRTYRTLVRSGSLYRYFQGANPSIHIIVSGGRVTLEGVVANRMDNQLAYMAARSVPNVFSVTNNLRIENAH